MLLLSFALLLSAMHICALTKTACLASSYHVPLWLDALSSSGLSSGDMRLSSAFASPSASLLTPFTNGKLELLEAHPHEEAGTCPAKVASH